MNECINAFWYIQFVQWRDKNYERSLPQIVYRPDTLEEFIELLIMVIIVYPSLNLFPHTGALILTTFENIAAKWEIAQNMQFLLLPDIFNSTQLLYFHK